MTESEGESIVEALLQAVHEQYFQPLAVALCTLTVACTRDKAMAVWVADTLRSQAQSCPEHVAGRGLLQALAELASLPERPSPDDVQATLRTRLRLIHGGRGGRTD